MTNKSDQKRKTLSLKIDADSNLPPSDMDEWAQDRMDTKFGSFLRKTSLDETPQLLNILFIFILFWLLFSVKISLKFLTPVSSVSISKLECEFSINLKIFSESSLALILSLFKIYFG